MPGQVAASQLSSPQGPVRAVYREASLLGRALSRDTAYQTRITLGSGSSPARTAFPLLKLRVEHLAVGADAGVSESGEQTNGKPM